MTQYLDTHKGLKKQLKYDICTAYFFENFLIVEMDEGINLTFESASKLVHDAILYYHGRPFIYISNRVHSYSVTPTDYFKLEEHVPNLIGFAVVSYSRLNKANANIENLFFNRPFEVFNELQEAMNWAESTIKKAL